ncbi:TPA: glycosyltransferase family 2 protein [Klebsiella michiganensis]
MEKEISIVLASFNGCKYIKEQIISIQKNIFYDKLVKEIIISDDNSTDETLSEINDLKLKDEKITIITNSGKGVISNFVNGLKNATGDYIFLCDQDDIWSENKIVSLYEGITSFPKNIPIMGISDSYLVDFELKKMGHTFFESNNVVFPRDLTKESLVVKNIAQGCVMVFNKELRELCDLDDYDKWVMHDWWLILLASIYGKIFVIERPLISYRVHDNNAVGIESGNRIKKIKKLKTFFYKYRVSLDKRISQYLFLIKKTGGKHFITPTDFYKYEVSFFRKTLALINFFYIKDKLNAKHF